MVRRLLVLFMASIVTAVLSFSPAAWVLAQTVSGQSPALQLPTIPDPVPVQLDASTTAFLALDVIDRYCSLAPTCAGSIPAIASGIAAARAANALVVYTVQTGLSILPDINPAAADPVVSNRSADRFFGTDLDNILRQAGVTTLVLAGTWTNGVVLFTSFAAQERGYSVVVVADGVSAPDSFRNLSALYQMLNEPGFANAQNAPLKPTAVTLSRTDLITYR